MSRIDYADQTEFISRVQRAAKHVVATANEPPYYPEEDMPLNDCLQVLRERAYTMIQPDMLAALKLLADGPQPNYMERSWLGFIIPDTKSPNQAGWQMLFSLPQSIAFKRPFTAYFEDPKVLQAWQEWARMGYYMWRHEEAVFRVCNQVLRMNTWGQVDRIWPKTARKFLHPSFQVTLANAKKRSPLPKGWTQPEGWEKDVELANAMISTAFVMLGDVRTVPLVAQKYVLFSRPVSQELT